MKDSRYITGIWSDNLTNGYHGAFELVLNHTRDRAEGMWIGHSLGGIVKGGKWVWFS